MRWKALVGLLLAALAIASPAAAQTGQKLVKTSATLKYVNINQDGNCGWGIGVVVGPVTGAASYLVKYWDGYWKRIEVRTLTKDELKSDPNRPEGSLFLGITGGWYSPPCSEGSDATEGGRFDKGAKAWAIFPAKHKAKPSIYVDVATPSGVRVGAAASVRVNVRAGELPLKNVSVSGLTGAGSVASVTKKPSGTSGFSLAAGGSKSFTYTVKALQAGAAALGASARGSSKQGSASGSGRGTLRVADADLALTVGTAPETVALDVDDEGKVAPKDVTVTARITNVGTTDVENVTLQSLNPEPVKKGQPLDQIAIAGGALPVELGTIPAGQSVSRDFTLTVTGDGRYRIRGLATYAAADGGTGKLSGLGGAFEVTVPPLFLKLEREDTNIEDRGGSPWIKAGASWYLNGTLKNISDHRRICVAPMLPKLTGNAASNGPVDIADRNLRDVGGPYAGALEPGHDAVLRMFVDTAAGGGTRSTAEVKLEGGVLDPGQDCNTKTYKGLDKLTPADIRIVDPPGTTFEVHVDTSVPVLAPNPVGATGKFILGVGRNLFVDTVQQGLDLMALAREQWSLESQYAGLLPYGTVTAYRFVVRSAQAIGVATDVYATWWKVATQKEKNDVFKRAGAFLSTASNDFYVNATGAVEDAAKPFMAKMEKAYAEGDDAEIGYLWGQVGGTLLQQVVVGEFLEAAGAVIVADSAKIEARVAQQAEKWAAEEAAQALRAETAGSAKAARKAVPNGTELSPAKTEGLWSIDGASDKAFRDIAHDFNAVVGVRSRGPGTVQKLKDGSVLKHEKFKPKNVNDIDVEYLGFRKGDLDEVRSRTYTDEQVAAITNRVRDDPNLTSTQKIGILDRFETRLHEEKAIADMQRYDKAHEVNVGFNHKDNGINRVTSPEIRRFQLDKTNATATGQVPAGGVYYTPLQENLELYHLRKTTDPLPKNCHRLLKSVLCTITGDVDGVYVTRVDGSAFSPEEMVQIYKRLAAAGWQHPETVTWIDKAGQFFFGAKADILKELGPAGEAMVEYGPDRVARATRLALEQSGLLNASTSDYVLSVLGGYTDTLRL